MLNITVIRISRKNNMMTLSSHITLQVIKLNQLDKDHVLIHRLF